MCRLTCWLLQLLGFRSLFAGAARGCSGPGDGDGACGCSGAGGDPAQAARRRERRRRFRAKLREAFAVWNEEADDASAPSAAPSAATPADPLEG